MDYVVLSLCAVVIVAVIPLYIHTGITYYKQRERQPVKQQGYEWVLAIQVLSLLAIMNHMLRGMLGAHYPTFIYMIFVIIFGNGRYILYEIRAIILLFRFKVTNNVRHLQAARRNAQGFINEAQLSWFLRRRALVTPPIIKRALRYIAAVILVFVIVVVASVPDAVSFDEEPVRGHALTWLSLSLCWLHLAIAAVLAYVLSKCGDDNFMIKTEMKIMAALYACHTLANTIFAFAPIPDGYPIDIFFNSALIVVSLVITVMKPTRAAIAYRMNPPTVPSGMTLPDIINFKQGYDSFLDFCCAEFSPQPLLFCRNVQELREASTRGRHGSMSTPTVRLYMAHKMELKAVDIYDQFIKPGAPSAVDLPEVLRSELTLLIAHCKGPTRLGDARETNGGMGPSTIQEEQSDNDDDSEDGDDDEDHNTGIEHSIRSNGTTINTTGHQRGGPSHGSGVTLLGTPGTLATLPPPSVSPNNHGSSMASLSLPPDPAAAIAKKSGLRIQTSPKPTPSTNHRRIIPFDPIENMMDSDKEREKDAVSPVNSGDDTDTNNNHKEKHSNGDSSKPKDDDYRVKPKAKEKKKEKKKKKSRMSSADKRRAEKKANRDKEKKMLSGLSSGGSSPSDLYEPGGGSNTLKPSDRITLIENMYNDSYKEVFDTMARELLPRYLASIQYKELTKHFPPEAFRDMVYQQPQSPRGTSLARSPRFSSHARSHSNSALLGPPSGLVRSPSGGLMIPPHVRSGSASGLHTRTPSGAVGEASNAVAIATAVASPRSGYQSFGGLTMSGAVVGAAIATAMEAAGASPRPSPRLSLSPRPSPRPHLHVGGVSNAGFDMGSASPVTPERFTPRRMLSNGLLAPSIASPVSQSSMSLNSNSPQPVLGQMSVLTSQPSIAIVIEPQPSVAESTNGSTSGGSTPYLFNPTPAAPASPRETTRRGTARLNANRLSMHGSNSPHPNFTPPSARKPSIGRRTSGSLSPYQSHDSSALAAAAGIGGGSERGGDRPTPLPGLIEVGKMDKSTIVEVANQKANEKRLSLGAEARANLEERFAKLGDKRGSLDLKRTSLHGQSLNDRLAAHAAAGGIPLNKGPVITTDSSDTTASPGAERLALRQRSEKRSSLGLGALQERLAVHTASGGVGLDPRRASLGLGALQERLESGGYSNKRASLRLGPTSMSNSSLFPMSMFKPKGEQQQQTTDAPPPKELTLSTSGASSLEPPPPSHLAHHLSASGPSSSQLGLSSSQQQQPPPLTTSNSMVSTTSTGSTMVPPPNVTPLNTSSNVNSPALTALGQPSSPSSLSIPLRTLQPTTSGAGAGSNGINANNNGTTTATSSPLFVPTVNGPIPITIPVVNTSPSPPPNNTPPRERHGSVSVVSLGPTASGVPVVGITPPISPHSRRDTWRLGGERSSHATTSFLSPTILQVANGTSSTNGPSHGSLAPSLSSASAPNGRHQLGAAQSFSQAIASARRTAGSPPPPPAVVTLANVDFNRPPDSG